MNEIDKLEGDALNRAVAEALGWRVRHQDIGMGGWRWENDLGQGRGQTYKTQELCEQMWFEGIPDYAQDLNAALALPLPDGWIYNVDFLPTEAAAVVVPPEGLSIGYSRANPQATAVCRAWLKYQAAQADDRYDERRANWRQGDAL